MASKKYRIREICGDWALDIPMENTIVTLFFNSQNNAKWVKAILEHEDAHKNEAVPYFPVFIQAVYNRIIELDELYTKVQAVTGFSVEKLLDMFLEGYTLTAPDKKHIECLYKESGDEKKQ